MNKHRLAAVEEYVLGFFRRAGVTRALAREIFDASPSYANADIVRAFEDLEKRQRALARRTEEGEDWVTLTPEGARLAGLPAPEEPPQPFPHPPKSST
ncbi:MAG TPA: hypothetical protein VE642_06930 [Pyrinomonadaceae bacterium]|jgi:hypothetical protein|nr:hypothetical protein [Pyrinomonadaceae bacterium]